MDREDCSCHAKGRLIIHIESEVEEAVKVTITEENLYCDIFYVYLKEKKGDLLVDGITYGKTRIETSIDYQQPIYYPSNVILFQKNNYVHKLNIIDRRKKSEL